MSGTTSEGCQVLSLDLLMVQFEELSEMHHAWLNTQMSASQKVQWRSQEFESVHAKE